MDTRNCKKHIVKHWPLLIIICVFVLAIASLITAIVKKQTTSESAQSDGTSNSSCLGCVRFLRTLSDPTTENVNTTVACLESSCSNYQEEISGVLGAVIDRQDSDQRKLRHFLDSKVYLRKMMIPSSTSDSGQVKLKFNTSETRSTDYDVLRVVLSSEEAYIPETGLYYVSSLVLFQINDSSFYSEGHNKTLIYTTRYTRRTKASSQILYQIFFRCCVDCVEILESKYYGGVFELEDGDIIDSFISHAD
ncbi:unnamed protein product, partial [Lymnaea stagnalis]